MKSIEIFISFIIGVLGSLLASYIFSLKRRQILSQFFQIEKYKLELTNQVKNMPFIYKDVEFEVIEGYVDIEIDVIRATNLDIIEKKASERAKDILIDKHKLLFLGGAGIGKTTLQRYAILSILDKKYKKRFLSKSEKVYPIFIPLKLVSNIEPSPIINYILNNVNFINNVKKLEKLLRSEKLMFFLDGYDEISFGDGINFIQEELNSIISPYNTTNQINEFTDIQFAKIYPLFNGCRVWFSSRKDFFKQHPVANIGEISGTKIINFGVVQLKGIGNNRLLLINKIFNKYIKHTNRLSELLNEEYFLNTIETSGDKDLISLSHNPLFLTVMCYIYVQNVLETKNHKISWMNNTEGLIIECIKLLLNDLDEEKARDLAPAFRDGLKNRRNLYYEEKLNFLRYFAAKLFDLQNMVFTLSDIKMHIIEYFSNSTNVKPEIKERIIEDLSDDNNRIPNFAFQLIYCGVFIIVNKNTNEIYYDFPHRRFREVLAIQSQSDPKEYAILLEKINENRYSEFIIFFKTTRIFNSLEFQKKSLSIILNKSLHLDNSVNSSKNFIKYLPTNIDISDILIDFLKEQIESKNRVFKLSKSLLKYVQQFDFIEYIKKQLYVKLQKGHNSQALLICDILIYNSKTSLQNILLDSFENDSIKTPELYIKYLYIMRSDTRVKMFISNLIIDNKIRFYLWHNIINKLVNPTNSIFENIDISSFEYRLEIACFVKKYSNSNFNAVCDILKLNSHNKNFNLNIFTLFDKDLNECKIELDSFNESQYQYIFTCDSISEISQFVNDSILSIEQEYTKKKNNYVTIDRNIPIKKEDNKNIDDVGTSIGKKRTSEIISGLIDVINKNLILNKPISNTNLIENAITHYFIKNDLLTKNIYDKKKKILSIKTKGLVIESNQSYVNLVMNKIIDLSQISRTHYSMIYNAYNLMVQEDIASFDYFE